MTQRGEEHGPLDIPLHARPVEFVLAQHEGREYVSFATIEEARRHPHGVMIMEADSGGQILLTCPAAQVRADAATLKRLLTDLEWICWGPGFRVGDPDEPCDAATYFEPLPPGSGVGGGMGGGWATRGLWLHDELEFHRLREQIAAVLSGDLPRLDLPPKFPEDEVMTTLGEARLHPEARLRMESGVLPYGLLLEAAVSIVKASEATLYRLGRDLDAKVAEQWGNVAPLFRREPRIVYRSRGHALRDIEFDLGPWGDPGRVRAVLEGKLDRM